MKKILAFLLCAVLLLTVAAPAALAETMTDATEATTVPTETTMSPTEDTTEVTQAPSDSATAPADPTQAPTTEGTAPETEAPTQAPTEAATTVGTEAPTEETTAPTEAPTEPVETEPVEEPVIPAVNYTEVGPLLPPVTISGGPRRAPAMYAQENDDGLFMEKNAVRNADGSVTLTMEVYTTGTVQTVTKAVPTDIILVLDESGSMKETLTSETVYKPSYDNRSGERYIYTNSGYQRVYYCGGSPMGWSCSGGWFDQDHGWSHGGTQYYPMTSEDDTTAGRVQFYTRETVTQTKMEALKTAANAFADNVSADAKKNEVDHRIAVVSFETDSSTLVGLTDVSTDTGLSTVKDKINSLYADGGTRINLGLGNAVNIFKNDKADGKRNRVVIVFTDGNPGLYGNWNEECISVANSAISYAKTLKASASDNGYGATVYTIGVVNGANPAAAIDYGDNGRLNRFLHFVSSNYPNATSLNDGGTGGSNKGYYLSANNADSLKEIFQKISDRIQTPTIELGTETVVKDIIAPQFTIPEGATVNLYTSDYNGKTFGDRESAGADIQATVEGDTLSVTGFDYTANFVSETAKKDGTYGKKLIIEVTVQQKSGFLGGNNVATNGAESGVYGKDGLVKPFPVPTVDVPIEDVTVTVTDKNIYLLGDLTQDQLLAGSTVKCGDVVLMENGVEKTLESWQTQYVDIVYTKPAVQNDPREDGSYTLSASVKSKTGTGEKTDSATGSIRVFLPEITWKDSLLALDETPDYMTENHVAVRWLHDGELENNMIGDRPTLSYGFTPDEAAVKKETYVTVHVQIDGVDVTDKVTLLHQDCDLVDDCSFNPANGQFLIHIGTFDLTINKDGCADIDENQSFLFRIDGPNGFSMEVTVQGNTSKTIKGLQMGEYTVTEVESWSWRYVCRDNKQVVKPEDVVNGKAEVTFVNDRSFSFWLNGCAFADNRWRRENA